MGDRMTDRDVIGAFVLTGIDDDPGFGPVRGAAIDKLADYEDAEQDGRLVRLPVRPGQALYKVRFSEFHCCHYVAEWTVIDIHLRKDRITIYFREGNGLSDAFSCDYGDSTWRDMYMTREEAEAALQGR